MQDKYSSSIDVYRIYHREAFRLGLFFDFNQDLKLLVKALGAKWSQSKRCWYLNDHKDAIPKLSESCKGKVWLNYKEINSRLSAHEKYLYYNILKESKEKKKALNVPKKAPKDYSHIPDEYQALLERRRYSESTQRTYLSMFSKYMEYFHKYNLDEIKDDQIKAYLHYLVKKKKVSKSYQNQMINSIKFYYEHVLGREKKKYWLDRPRKEYKLPTILSEEEMMQLLGKINNQKHLCIAAILYSSGLRRSEILNIRKGDVDLHRFEIKIRSAKGNKDRMVILSKNIVPLLVKYVKKYKPTYWLFEGEQRTKYSATSVRQIIKKATEEAGIAKHVTPHVLRHSYATHLIEQGVDIIYVQKLLGHNSVKTTQIYTHVSNKSLRNIESPLDRILKDRKLNDNNLNKK